MDKAASTGHSDRCRIVVDTCCDFSPEVAANLDVDILGFPFIIDGEERTDDIWSSMSPKEFYDRMRAGARVSTSAVSLGRYIEFFTECAKEGTPTVYLCFTSALSSSYNSACQAADVVRAEYPNFELYVVDNALPCATGALLALEAVRQRSAGLTAKQLVDWANEAKTYVHGYFTLESFDALAAGGRIPPAAAQLTAKLDVKPELSYDLAGSLSLIGVNRGRKKALKSILKSFRENYVPDRTMPIAIMTADAEKDGDWLEAAIRKGTGQDAGGDIIEINYEGYGPGGVAVIVETATDNRNRTVAEIRHLMSKGGGSMGENGCVSWKFERKGVIQFSKEKYTEDQLMEAALEAGADDLRDEGDVWEIQTAMADFNAVREAFEAAGLEMISAELNQVPQTTMEVDLETARKLLRFIELLEDNDDVQNVYSDADISDEIMAQLED